MSCAASPDTVPSAYSLRERARTGDTGCACPNCKSNIASTHGAHQLLTTAIEDTTVQDDVDALTIRVNGWVCHDCGILVPREMEASNSCWARMTNADEEFVGICIRRADETIVAPLHVEDLPTAVIDELGEFCPECGREYGGCVSNARCPCRPCRGGRDYWSWTKTDDDRPRHEPKTTPLQYYFGSANETGRRL